jgi:hypothetical protein
MQEDIRIKSAMTRFSLYAGPYQAFEEAQKNNSSVCFLLIAPTKDAVAHTSTEFCCFTQC